MKKALKLDLYKIFHSKVIVISLIAFMVLDLMFPIIKFVSNWIGQSVPESVIFDGTIMLATMIISALFANVDISSGFMNNVYSRQGKTSYVLSKFLCILFFVLFFVIWSFILNMIFDLIFGYGGFFNEKYDMWYRIDYNIIHTDGSYGTRGYSIPQILISLLLKIVIDFIVGVEMYSLSSITKSPIIVIIIMMTYGLFLWDYVFRLSYVLGFNPNAWITVYGNEVRIIIINKTWTSRTIIRFVSRVLNYLLHFILYVVLSFLAFRNKRSKKDICEDCILEARGISKSFKKKQALHDVNIKIQKGEIYGLVGNNGAGKTTLLKIMFGIMAPNEGKIYTSNTNLSTGALISKPNLYKDMSAFENVKAMAIAIGYKCEDKEINELLELVGLKDTGKKWAGRFSTGMKQRLGIALAIIGNPEVLILDEPINGLDIEGIMDVRNILLKLNREKGTTIIVSSHILDELAKITTRICLMNKGKIVFEDTMENFMKKSNGKSAEESYMEILSENVSA